MILVLFGPPGAGKGTQAAVICKELGIPQVATGDIFRRHLKEGTDLGTLARTFIDKGQLVPDEVVWDLVADRLQQEDCANGVLLDGFPRSVRQAELLVGWLGERDEQIDCVAALEIEDEELVRRLSGRRTCITCGATYHVEHNPPVTEGVCTQCGGEVVQRDDDSPDTVRARLDTYHHQTEPVLGYFEGLGLVEQVHASGPIQAVTQRIRLAIG